MRERPALRFTARFGIGITPARAGKTLIDVYRLGLERDYPRSCGKDCFPSVQFSEPVGSPPLVRERPAEYAGKDLSFRITPARAGKTSEVPELLFPDEDHPRSCGKDTKETLHDCLIWGSPPLVRERREEERLQEFDNWITPARAGKTGRHSFRIDGDGDHPRSCGKDHDAGPFGRRRLGSPPLVRERPGSSSHRTGRCRITPARAGKTADNWYRCAGLQDHLRSCGKDNIFLHSKSEWQGSPPLVRERLIRRLRAYREPGITPARAGKT